MAPTNIGTSLKCCSGAVGHSSKEKASEAANPPVLMLPAPQSACNNERLGPCKAGPHGWSFATDDQPTIDSPRWEKKKRKETAPAVAMHSHHTQKHNCQGLLQELASVQQLVQLIGFHAKSAGECLVSFETVMQSVLLDEHAGAALGSHKVPAADQLKAAAEPKSPLAPFFQTRERSSDERATVVSTNTTNNRHTEMPPASKAPEEFSAAENSVVSPRTNTAGLLVRRGSNASLVSQNDSQKSTRGSFDFVQSKSEMGRPSFASRGSFDFGESKTTIGRPSFASTDTDESQRAHDDPLNKFRRYRARKNSLPDARKNILDRKNVLELQNLQLQDIPGDRNSEDRSPTSPFAFQKVWSRVSGRRPSEQSDQGSVAAFPSKTRDEVGTPAGTDTNENQSSWESSKEGSWEKVKNDRRKTCRKSIWAFLEQPTSSPAALAYAYISPILVLFTVIVTFLSTMNELASSIDMLSVLDLLMDCFFAFELLLRLGACLSIAGFLRNWYNVIDIVCVLPLPIKALTSFRLPGNTSTLENAILHVAVICIIPAMRLIKTTRHNWGFRILVKSLKIAFEALPVPSYLLLVIMVTFSSILYVIEPRTNLASMSDALWLVLVTVSTVGYGDVTPETQAGKFVSGVLIVVGVLYTAMPIQIVGDAFTGVWKNRDKILLVERTRDVLNQWGYSSEDVQVFFEYFDSDHNGSLDIVEFRTMMQEIQPGIQESRVIELFQVLDDDGGGNISAEEFLKVVFPEWVAYAAAEESNSPEDEAEQR